MHDYIEKKDKKKKESRPLFKDVKIHYNSEKPAKLQALAYTQGDQIYLGPGQERHLDHELGHVIQQKQGRVQATTTVNGMKVNDSPYLEQEADTLYSSYRDISLSDADDSSDIVQRLIDVDTVLTKAAEPVQDHEVYCLPAGIKPFDGAGVSKKVYIHGSYVILTSSKEIHIKEEVEKIKELKNDGFPVPEISEMFWLLINEKTPWAAFLETKLSKKPDEKLVESKRAKMDSPSGEAGDTFAEKILSQLQNDPEAEQKCKTAYDDCCKILARYDAMREKDKDYCIADLQVAFDYDSGHVYIIDPAGESLGANKGKTTVNNHYRMLNAIIGCLKARRVGTKKYSFKA